MRVFPHIGRGFTQGLCYQEDILYEGTGLVNRSKINLLTAADGNISRSIPLDKFFGEGIAIRHNRLVQLTWKAEKAFAYSFPQLEIIDTLSYRGEGWGLTCDTLDWIMSNGSDTLFFRDSLFSIRRRLPVKANGQPVYKLNELEYARGMIYANVWYKTYLVEINPADGTVIRLIDCRNLFTVEKPESHDRVLNGIAYNPGTRTFYLTGKLWKNIFEVSIPDL
jgi:glutamine cyclotransferase